MGFWTSAGIPVKIVIILGTLVLIAFVLGLIKFIIDRRRFAKHNRHQELGGTGKDDILQLNQRELDEGSLFGIRIINTELQSEFQSRPTTAAESLTNSFDNSRWATKNTTGIIHGEPNNLSGTTLNSSGICTPSPKRLTLGFSSVQISEFHIDDYLETAKSPQKNGLLLSTPLGECSSAITFEPEPEVLSSPDLKENSTGEADHIATQLTLLSGCSMACDTGTPSVSSRESSLAVHIFPLAPAPVNRSCGNESTTFSSAPPTIPPQVARRREKSFMNGLDDELERLPSRKRGDKGDPIAWALSHTYSNSNILGIKSRSDSCQFTWDNSQVSTEEGNDSQMRDSLASIYSDEDPLPNRLSAASFQQQSLELHSFSSVPKQPDPSTRPQPTNHSRIKSSGSLKRTYDSIQIMHSRNSSKGSTSKGNETSSEAEGQGDQIHYDAKNHHKNGSDSIHGIAAGFDNRKESPFSDSKALDNEMRTRSRSSSTTSSHYGNHNRSRSNSQRVTSVPTGEKAKERRSVSGSDANSLHTIPTISVGRYRSDSEGSMSSISDMYESYLKKGIAKPAPSMSEDSGLFDINIQTEGEQMEHERVEREGNGLLSASAAVAGTRMKTSPPASLVIDSSEGKRVPRAIESPVSKWRK